MAIDREQEAQDRSDYAEAWGSDGASEQPSETVGEGGPGLDGEGEGEGAGGPDGAGEGEGGEGTVTVTVEEGGDGGQAGTTGGPIERQQQGDAGGDAAAGNAEVVDSGATSQPAEGAEGSAAVAEGGQEMDLSDVPAEEAQRAKSWAGRLKTREDELKTREADLDAREAKLAAAPPAEQAEAIEQVADTAKNPDMAAAADEMAQRVEAGEISPAEAIAALKEDFGEPFVNMVTAVARSAVSDELGSLRRDYETDITNIADRANRDHFETIHDAYPDAFDLAKTDEFKAWVDQHGKQDIVENGSARQVIKLIRDYKSEHQGGEAAAPAAAPAAPAAAAAPAPAVQSASDEQVNAASAVPRRGVSVPPRPREVASDDYAGAWNQF